MRTYSLELVEQVVVANEQTWDIREVLEAERHMIPKYLEETITITSHMLGLEGV